MSSLAESFARDKYVAAPGLLNGPALAFFYDYAVKMSRGKQDPKSGEVPGLPAAYGDPMMELLLDKMLPRVEAASGLRLYPTYSYLRVYQPGATLERHRDRPSCEVSVTLSLGFQAPAHWPIWIEGPNGTTGVALEPGDALLYRGCDCYHWRERFEGEHAAQVFLHYVDQDGPWAEWKFDKRPGLTPFPAHLKCLFQV